jgi:hypothetical protein
VTLCLPVHGCDSVNGGAVELSWKLRPASSALPEKFVDCASGQPGALPVTRIRLGWQVPVGDTMQEGSESWPCQDNHGATGFELPQGTADLSVTPECGTGSSVTEAAPNTYIAPATVQRLVTPGDTVSLGAVELVVSVSDCRDAPGAGAAAQPCICDRP